MTQLPQRKGWDGRRAAPYAGPDPFELSRRRAEAEAAEQRAEEATEPAGQSDEPRPAGLLATHRVPP